MAGKYSDYLPSFKGEPEEGDEKERDFERFAPWVKDAFKEGSRRPARPLMRIAALLIMILCLAWSASRPSKIKGVLLDEEHPRAAIPIGIAVGDSPPWTVDGVRSVIEAVQPEAAACLQGWTEMATNEDGMVVAEVVLTPTGPDEAAIYDQVGPIPDSIANCLGRAIGSKSWPVPPKTESVVFPILGQKG